MVEMKHSLDVVHVVPPDGGEATERFVDLGVGYFCFEREDRTVILDCFASKPDMYFGPAAWGGGHGPHSGMRLGEVKPTRLGAYDQVAEGEWKWCMPDGTELDVEPPSWPRRLDVAGEANALRHLHGVEFSDEATLVFGAARRGVWIAAKEPGRNIRLWKARSIQIQFPAHFWLATHSVKLMSGCHKP